MPAGSVTLSIDLELAWGNWDNLTPDILAQVEARERPIVARLVETLDRHDMPATWAFVAALLDPLAATARPGPQSAWYAPDVIDRIRAAKTRHDFGSHGGHHRYFDTMSGQEADEELSYAADIHRRHGLPFTSFVFPRNKVAGIERLASHGLKVYRGTDPAWHQAIRNRNQALGRAANLVDKMLPITPVTVRAERDGPMANLPGSMLLIGRNGVRRMISPAIVRRKLRAGLQRAAESGGTFHLWFHPSNFWHDTDRQFALFGDFLTQARTLIDGGRLASRTMADFA